MDGVLCRTDRLLYLDCLDDSYELIGKPADMKPFRIAVLFSGLERSLATSALYELRRTRAPAVLGEFGYHDNFRLPTHIIVSAASSRLGDYFTGSSESRMWLDDLRLVY